MYKLFKKLPAISKREYDLILSVKPKYRSIFKNKDKGNVCLLLQKRNANSKLNKSIKDYLAFCQTKLYCI